MKIKNHRSTTAGVVPSDAIANTEGVFSVNIADTPPSVWVGDGTGVRKIGSVVSGTEPANPTEGSIWANSNTNDVFMYVNGEWLRLNGGGGIFTPEEQVATAGQTVFNLSLITYQPNTNRMSVYRNGVRLRPTDFDETSSTQVTLTEPASLNDEMLFLSGEEVSDADAYVLKTGDTMTGALTLPDDPVNPLEASTKQYVDTAVLTAPRQNILINGGFDVWQRGTSFATKNAYTADRWKANSNGTGTFIAVQQASGESTFKYQLTVSDTAAGTYLRAYQNIESINSVSLVNKTITVSVYARHPVGQGDGDLSVFCGYPSTEDNFGTAINFVPQSQIKTLGSTMSRYDFQLTLSSSGGVTAANGLQVIIDYVPAVGGTEFSITGVKLEKGSTATDWVYEDYGTTLAKCQRYYERMSGAEYTYIATGNTTSAAGAYAYAFYQVKKRTIPTISFGGALGCMQLTGVSFTSPVTDITATTSTISTLSARLNLAVSGMTAANMCALRTEDDSSAFVAFDAEL